MLPTIARPTYECKLYDGTTVEFRPFLAKEEKVLLMAAEGKDIAGFARAMVQVMKACVVVGPDVETMPHYDAEFLFVNLRAKSVGEVVEVPYQHPVRLGEQVARNAKGEECAHRTDVKVRLDNAVVTPTEDWDPKMIVKLNGQFSLKLRPPTLIEANADTAMIPIDLVARCLVSVFDSAAVNLPESVEESLRFMEQLDHAQMEAVLSCFDKMPKLRAVVKYACKGCSEERELKLIGIRDFF